jgi:hypothetical protein
MGETALFQNGTGQYVGVNPESIRMDVEMAGSSLLALG